MGQSLFTFDELKTLLTQIEACLNSRPLYPMPSNPTDLETLTPGLILVGEALVSLPDINLIEVKINRLDRWQLIQRKLQEFWKRCMSEYISTLQTKTKWKTSQENLAINDLVMVHDDALPPSKWKVGRVIELHPSPDENIRVVTLKTMTGNIK